MDIKSSGVQGTVGGAGSHRPYMERRRSMPRSTVQRVFFPVISYYTEFNLKLKVHMEPHVISQLLSANLCPIEPDKIEDVLS